MWPSELTNEQLNREIDIAQIRLNDLHDEINERLSAEEEEPNDFDDDGNPDDDEEPETPRMPE